MKPSASSRQQVDVYVGKAGVPVGRLSYVRQGQRENSSFVYHPTWLERPDAFEVSPDLPLTAVHQHRRAPAKADSVFRTTDSSMPAKGSGGWHPRST